MTRRFQLFLLLPLLIACNTSRISTTNIQDLASFEPEANIYALPQTRLVITVKVVRSTFYPGPFSKYSEKYLGIEGAQNISNVHWDITDISFSKLTEPDKEHFYSIKGQSGLFEEISALERDGLLFYPASLNSFQVFYNDAIDPVEEIHYTDLSISPFFYDKEKKKKSGARDSNFYGIPVSKDYVQEKSTAEKAKEAAAFIFKMRKRRFKLLAGQYDVFPEGTALETSVREINELEEEYLSLFIGKVETDTIQKVFTYTPVAREKLQRTTIFRFSSETGFSNAGSSIGVPIVMEVADLDKTGVLEQLQLPVSASSYQDILFYRIPDKGRVKILYGSRILNEAEVPVCQFGALIPKYIYPRKAKD